MRSCVSEEQEKKSGIDKNYINCEIETRIDIVEEEEKHYQKEKKKKLCLEKGEKISFKI